MEIKNNGLVKLVYLLSTSYRGAPGAAGRRLERRPAGLSGAGLFRARQRLSILGPFSTGGQGISSRPQHPE